jgi:hypothetical protein
VAAGISEHRATQLLKPAQACGHVHRWTMGINLPAGFAVRPKSEPAVGERSSQFSVATWTGAVTGAGDAPALIVGDSGTPPNSPSADKDDFSSNHLLGAGFLLADGSVRSINNVIDLRVWNALATRSGGETESGGEC